MINIDHRGSVYASMTGSLGTAHDLDDQEAGALEAQQFAKFSAGAMKLTMAQAKRLVLKLYKRSVAAGGWAPEEKAKLAKGLPKMVERLEAACGPDVGCFFKQVELPENLSAAAFLSELDAVKKSGTGAGSTAGVLVLGAIVGILALTAAG